MILTIAGLIFCLVDIGCYIALSLWWHELKKYEETLIARSRTLR